MLLARYHSRAQSAERHPGHGEENQNAELRANLERGVYAPLSLPGAALIVDTTDFAAVDEQRLMRSIRARAEGSGAGEDAC